MKHNITSGRGRARLGVASFGALALLIAASSGAEAVAVPIPLGDAYGFAVLGATGVTNIGPTVLNGDLGSYPDPSIDGGITVNGTNFAGGPESAAAQISLDAAITNAGGQGPLDGTISADLGGQTLTPGVYDQGGTMNLNGVLTLNAGGDPNAVWIFRGGQEIVMGVGSSVVLAGGAQACNVYWVSVAETTIGGSANIIGTVMAGTSVTMGTDARLTGRALAATGSVSLLSNTITQVGCAVAPAGGVGAGDGSSSAAGGNSSTAIMAATLLVGGLGVGAAVLIRRRRIENA